MAFSAPRRASAIDIAISRCSSGTIRSVAGAIDHRKSAAIAPGPECEWLAWIVTASRGTLQG
jgi:hypothetical protein